MKEQFVPYELALKLKELGFDEECFGVYMHFFNGSECYVELELDHTIHIKNSLLTKKPKYYFFSEHSVAAPLWQQAFDWIMNKYNLWFYIKLDKPNHIGDFTYVIEKPFEDGELYSEICMCTQHALRFGMQKLIEIIEQLPNENEE